LIRISVGGLAAQEIRDLVAELGRDQVRVDITTDVAGAKAVAEGKAEYYIGACATGAGGALAMAIAILGYSNCFSVSTSGKPPKADEVRKAVDDGKKAFGLTTDHVETAVPLIMEAILEKESVECSCSKRPPLDQRANKGGE
jgi:hypothetical protein